MDIGSQSDWHISVGELTFNVGESTSSVGELVIGKLTRWQNDRFSANAFAFSVFQFHPK